MWRLNLTDETIENVFPAKNNLQSQAYKTNYFFTIVLCPYLTIPVQHFATSVKDETDSRRSRRFDNANISNDSSRSSSRASMCSSSSTSSNLPLPPSLLRLDCKQSLINDHHKASNLSPKSNTKLLTKIKENPEIIIENDKLNYVKTKQKIIKLQKLESSLTRTNFIELETKFPLICCHVDIKKQFIRSIEKGQKICA